MAEFVQIRMEEIIPELEQLSRLSIFNEGEIKKIIKCRKEFEYKLQRRTKQEKDYIDYIDYEIKLVEEIQSRRRILRINKKKLNIEYTILKRIIDLYKNVLERFGDNLNIWYSFISFGTRVKFHSAVSRGITRMIEKHIGVPEVWKVAAKWHKESAKSVEEARKLLTRGLQHNSDSLILYIELFDLELSAIKKFNKQKYQNEENLKCLKAADIIFKLGMNALPDKVAIDFAATALNLADEITCTLDLQQNIINVLIEKYPLYEKTWDIIAKRELKCKKTESKEKVEKCLQIYENAVEQISTSEMWSFYLNTVFEIDDIEDVEKRKILFDAHYAGLSVGIPFLSENQYFYLLEMCEKEEKGHILKKATKILCVPSLWYERLEYFFSVNDKDQIEKTLKESIEYIGEEASLLWKRKFEYFMLTDRTETEIVSEFNNAMKIVSKPIADILVVLQIEFLAKKNGIKAARNAYNEAIRNIPPLTLHEKMYEIEIQNNKPICVKTCRRILEAACTQYGRTEPNIWINRIKFEFEHAPFTVSRIYNDAITTLEIKHLKLFESQFELIRNG